MVKDTVENIIRGLGPFSLNQFSNELTLNQNYNLFQTIEILAIIFSVDV